MGGAARPDDGLVYRHLKEARGGAQLTEAVRTRTLLHVVTELKGG